MKMILLWLSILAFCTLLFRLMLRRIQVGEIEIVHLGPMDAMIGVLPK
jgi:hypothetical protein